MDLIMGFPDGKIKKRRTTQPPTENVKSWYIHPGSFFMSPINHQDKQCLVPQLDTK